MNTVDLRNTGPNPIVVALTHQDTCKPAKRCICARNGRWQSVHIMPGCWARGVPAEALVCPHLRALIEDGTVHVRLEAGQPEQAQQKTNLGGGKRTARTRKE
jgi:hypothetical protein